MEERFLIQQSIAGHNQSFERLVILYEEKLMRFLRIRCSSVTDAEDIFQETFINAHKYLSSYDPKYAFSTWLFNIAINATHRFYRTHPNHDTLENSHHNFRPDDTNVWPMVRKNLNHDHFEILWLTYAEGYTGKEVSAILEKSLPWVKINILRAKEKLRTLLERDQLTIADWVS